MGVGLTYQNKKYPGSSSSDLSCVCGEGGRERIHEGHMHKKRVELCRTENLWRNYYTIKKGRGHSKRRPSMDFSYNTNCPQVALGSSDP